MQDLTALGFSPTIAARLHARLTSTPTGCTEWQGARFRFGHGAIAIGPRGSGITGTHRVSWMLEHGPIPGGLMVLHTCDNPPCCNPDHLYLGTAADNTADMVTRGRARGRFSS